MPDNSGIRTVRTFRRHEQMKLGENLASGLGRRSNIIRRQCSDSTLDFLKPNLGAPARMASVT